MKKQIVVSLALAILLLGVFTVPVNNTEYAEGMAIEINNQDVILYSNENRMADILNYLDDTNSDNLEISQHTISIFDSSWIDNKTESETKETILNSLNNHNPSIIVDGGYFMNSKIINKVSASSPNEQIHCAYLDENGITYEYSISDRYSESEAIRLAYEWVNNISENSTDTIESKTEQCNVQETVQSNSPHWSLIGIITYSEPLLNNRGSFALTIEVSQLMDFNDPEKDYFQLHYYVYGTANSDDGYRLSEMTLLYGLPEGTNVYRHGPTNTSGTSGSTVGVNLGISGSGSGPGVSGGVSGSWSYSISDVTVDNRSSIADNNIEIIHDIDENRNVGKAYCSEPGVMLTVDKEIDSNYISYTHTEHHYVDTCHHEEKLFGLIDDNTEYYNHWIPYYVTVYNGHTEGDYATWN